MAKYKREKSPSRARIDYRRNMLDVFLKLYDLDQSYHNQKERRAWLAIIGYIGFSLIAIKWLASQDIHSFCVYQKWWLTAFIFTVYACAMSFIFLQFLGRWQAVARTGAFDRIIYRIQERKQIPSLKHLRNIDTEYHEECKRRILQILLLTLLLPIFFFVWIIYSSRKTHKEEEEYKPPCPPCGWIKSLMNSRYMTEIPTYTLATWFLFIKIAMVWQWGLFPLGNTS